MYHKVLWFLQPMAFWMIQSFNSLYKVNLCSLSPGFLCWLLVTFSSSPFSSAIKYHWKVPWTHHAILDLYIFVCVCRSPRNVLVPFLDLSSSIYSPKFFFWMMSLGFSGPSSTWLRCPFYVCPWLTFTMVCML